VAGACRRPPHRPSSRAPDAVHDNDKDDEINIIVMVMIMMMVVIIMMVMMIDMARVGGRRIVRHQEHLTPCMIMIRMMKLI
jgi:hypothetical protein